jgi:large subunit ribosomal protein L29
MAKKKAPVTDATDAELLSRLADYREELFNLRFQLVTGQLENSSRIKQVKKDIARVLTELREREIAAAEALAAEATTKENA